MAPNNWPSRSPPLQDSLATVGQSEYNSLLLVCPHLKEKIPAFTTLPVVPPGMSPNNQLSGSPLSQNKPATDGQSEYNNLLLVCPQLKENITDKILEAVAKVQNRSVTTTPPNITTTSRVAWVLDENHYNSDGDGDSSERDLHLAWVFPSGLDVGRRVQYYGKYSYKEWTRYGCHTDKESQTLAIGEVVSIVEDVVKFTWEGAASQEKGCAWCTSTTPGETLTVKSSKDHNYSQRGRRDDTRSEKSLKCRNDYQIKAPDEAWALLPRELQ